MILTNTRTGESYYDAYPTFIAEKIGRNRKTVKEWMLSGKKFVIIQEWIVFFHPEKVTQQKGFALKK